MTEKEMIGDIQKQIGKSEDKTVYRILCTTREETNLELALEKEGYGFDRSKSPTRLTINGDYVSYNVYTISKRNKDESK